MKPSPEALARLAHELMLTATERAYLFELAGRLDPEFPSGLAISLIAADNAVKNPAYGVDRFWNACCRSGAASDLHYS